jgi:hypothetical protein
MTSGSAGQRWAVFGFMAAVTCLLVAYLYAEMDSGAAGAGGVLVYGLAAGFGLEFLGSGWRSIWRTGPRTGSGTGDGVPEEL